MVTFLCTVFNRSILTHRVCHVLANRYQNHFCPHRKHVILETQIPTSSSPKNSITFLISPQPVNETTLHHIALHWVKFILQFSFKGQIYFLSPACSITPGVVTSRGEKLTQQRQGLGDGWGAACPSLFRSAVLRCREQYSFLPLLPSQNTSNEFQEKCVI